ncbi:MAG: hypothetical protein ACK4KW_14035 [Gemmobacter sp.]
MRKTVLAALLALGGVSAPAEAAWVQIVPSNEYVGEGRFGPILIVWRAGQIWQFSVARGEVPREVVRDERRAIPWVIERLGLDPRRDTIEFCPGALVGVYCVDPPFFDLP